ncbi:phage integrase N-terminal SAM-like domain-containing protein [Peribacillus frigoritolerans]|uniref:phage integrase N-terminal SAM-like domain-containing protein n=1 Tax=Peribacillus frigoritolerans TaxID=450367 RepID=UPI002E200110|nr:phage integrase N-terminal SAM-like domain-containing protein [Peribacillus frigoritolerans]MED4697206.1 phage integrase N-terminal SAM-like domain-containing protein [Peribacillus frigoritolerans]
MINIQAVDKRIEKSSPKNIQWFYNFREYIVKQKNTSYQNYLSTIRQLYEFHNHQEVNKINTMDIQDFLLRNDICEQ